MILVWLPLSTAAALNSDTTLGLKTLLYILEECKLINIMCYFQILIRIQIRIVNACINRYDYAFAIPICGASPPNSKFPAGPTVAPSPTQAPVTLPRRSPTLPPVTSSPISSGLSFQYATVYQWSPGSSTAVSLGVYDPKKWTFGYLNGNFAVGFEVFNGTASSRCPGGARRRSYVYLQCNPLYNTSFPLISTREVTTCVCKYLISFRIIFFAFYDILMAKIHFSY